jgi:hypothetical protein
MIYAQLACNVLDVTIQIVLWWFVQMQNERCKFWTNYAFLTKI